MANKKLLESSLKLCEYGCNEYAQYISSTKKFCCNELTIRCKGVQERKAAKLKACDKAVIMSKRKATNLAKYGVEHVSQDPSNREKAKQTTFDRYGVYNINYSNEHVAKRKQNNLRKYGVECPLSLQTVIDKRIATLIDRYGTDNPQRIVEVRERTNLSNEKLYGGKSCFSSAAIRETAQKKLFDNYGVLTPQESSIIREKTKVTNQARYGFDCPLASPQVQQKHKDTMMERYGVEHTSHHPEMSERIHKSGRRFKSYIKSDGSLIDVQGYEPFALDILFQKHSLDEVLTRRVDVPAIWYQSEDQKKHRYYPDIFIPKLNKIIEVKSWYTYQKDLETNHLKKQAALNIGFLFEFWIFDDKKNLAIL